jgi:hypothetical protein
MSERCIVRVKFTPAGGFGEVRRAVGGFLRYVQHRDLHPDSRSQPRSAPVSGLLKYVAYRDKASGRAELLGPKGCAGTAGRKEFANFVGRSIEGSQAQLYRTRDGSQMDRRRAVSRFVISPERAAGLDLSALTRVAMARLESEMGVSGLRWIAAIHRNTRHHHVHLVVAGMHEVDGGFRRVDITKSRLAAIKEAVALEIERQRGERVLHKAVDRPFASDSTGRGSFGLPALKLQVARPALIRALPVAPLARVRVASSGASSSSSHQLQFSGSVLRLRAIARRYQRRMERELESDARRRGLEWAA